ncbi:MAG: DNA polymerase III subunit beta [Candidatus Fermentithermobacillus carboniphilus]|uniref:Beta sliding clamp n=1 Tax=Candidatus Fermentithermobacillus carboniphilus TaxID=3085328 RepID=A0AAT9L9T8_9FIRM|nr:MAG: DNA polymerase III subunit beta [Candidatus Fermentithermobacillus carboniphilus]
MNLTITRENLVWLVETASRPIPPRTTLPTIKGCLIEALSDRVIFSGTNLDWGVRASSEAEVTSSGSLVVSSKLLQDVVRTIVTPEVTMSLDASAWALSVKSGTSEMVLNAVPADDFPKWPETSGGEKVSLKADMFRELVKIGASCAVTNPTRPLWGACLLDLQEDRVVAVSTDQFALSRAVARVKAKPGRAIIPANVLQDIARLKDTEDSDEITFEISDSYIYFTSRNLSCFSRLIEGQYYAYEQVIPKTFTSSARVSTEALARAASRAAIVASEEDRAMRIIVDRSAKTLVVKAGSPDKGKMEETIPAEITGEHMEIWVQHKYILQALGRISTEETFVGLTGQVSPMKIEPVPNDGSRNGGVEATFVIMPMSPKGAF